MLALGLMSGTSMDGIDAALIFTDGYARVSPGAFLTVPYPPAFRDRLRGCLGAETMTPEIADVARALTRAHGMAVHTLLEQAGISGDQVMVAGFHGHTIYHAPGGPRPRTWQIGDGALLAQDTGIAVVDDFRTRDVAAGGQGAPLVPLYHRALAAAAGLPLPLAVLNIGGVANVTWIGPDATEADATEAAGAGARGVGPDGVGQDGAAPSNPNGTLLAFDTGPGNALIDDWLLAGCGRPYDTGGAIAATGTVDTAVLARLLAHPYFDLPAPKSLDRTDFSSAPVAGLSLADGAATLTAFTVAAVGRAVGLLPAPPRRWLVTGGGRHNGTLMAGLAATLGVPVDPVEAVGWNGDALEAQAFAYLAVRSRLGLPLSVPGTTGVPRPMTGGHFHPVPAPAPNPTPVAGPCTARSPERRPEPVTNP